jgi:hypothetical protein
VPCPSASVSSDSNAAITDLLERHPFQAGVPYRPSTKPELVRAVISSGSTSLRALGSPDTGAFGGKWLPALAAIPTRTSRPGMVRIFPCGGVRSAVSRVMIERSVPLSVGRTGLSRMCCLHRPSCLRTMTI